MPKKGEKPGASAKKEKVQAPGQFSAQDMALAAFEFLGIKQKIAALEKDQAKCRKVIEDHADEFLVEDPATGHKDWVGVHAGQRVKVTKQRRITSKPVVGIEELLEENNLQRFIEDVPTVNLTKLEIAIKEGDIKPRLAQELFEVSTNYSLIIKAEVGPKPTDEDSA